MPLTYAVYNHLSYYCYTAFLLVRFVLIMKSEGKQDSLAAPYGSIKIFQRIYSRLLQPGHKEAVKKRAEAVIQQIFQFCHVALHLPARFLHFSSFFMHSQSRLHTSHYSLFLYPSSAFLPVFFCFLIILYLSWSFLSVFFCSSFPLSISSTLAFLLPLHPHPLSIIHPVHSCLHSFIPHSLTILIIPPCLLLLHPLL